MFCDHLGDPCEPSVKTRRPTKQHQQMNKQPKLQTDSLASRQLLKVSSAARQEPKNRPVRL